MMLMKRNGNILILICSNKVQKSGISVMIDIDGGAAPSSKFEQL